MEHKLYHYKAHVVDVYDGDTCTVDIDLGLSTWVSRGKGPFEPDQCTGGEGILKSKRHSVKRCPEKAYCGQGSVPANDQGSKRKVRPVSGRDLGFRR
jgi:hypothetical protein